MRTERGWRIAGLILVLVLIGAACTSSSSGSSEQAGTATSGPSGTTPSGDGAGTGDTDGSDDGGENPEPDDPAVERPPSLRRSLAEFDSYRLFMRIAITGTEVASNDTTMQVDFSRSEGGWHQTMTAVNDPEIGPETTEAYWKNGLSCQFDGEIWEPAPLALQDQEIINLFWYQMDILPVVENPTLVGEEDYLGTPARHYTFPISGLGLQSGVVPTQAAGEYWLTQDGGQLLGYRVTLEARTGPANDPNAEVVGGEMTIEVSEVNTSIPITPPPDCTLPPELELPTGPLGPATGSGAPPPDPADLPPPLRQGLAQLDSFVLEATMDLGGPEVGQTGIDLILESSTAEGGWHLAMISTSEGETSTSETYWKGDLACEFDGEAWTVAELTDQDREFLGIYWNLIDFVPVVTEPLLVGTEDFQGIPSRHYTFTIAGLHPADLGGTSSGEYWLAEDGGYMVGYRGEFSTPAASGAGSVVGEMNMSVGNVNQPVAINPPPECTAPPAGE